MGSIAVIEIGGTHATAAMVDTSTWSLSTPPRRVELDAHAGADALLTAIADSAIGLDAPTWGIAIPDPFDYGAGIGRFHDVGKFESLDGVDVRAELAQELGVAPATLSFCNDADAFTLGEWVSGAGRGSHRCVGLTLGTGVGTGWVVDGLITDPGMPPGGRIHQLSVDGQPLEATMSRRAIRAAYRDATGDGSADVREIASLARDGDETATTVLAKAFGTLGSAVAQAVTDFAADVLVVGGSMARSWDLFEPWFLDGWIGTPRRIELAQAGDDAPLIGAGYAAAFGH